MQVRPSLRHGWRGGGAGWALRTGLRFIGQGVGHGGGGADRISGTVNMSHRVEDICVRGHAREQFTNYIIISLHR